MREQPSHKLVHIWMAVAGLVGWVSGRFGPFGVHEGSSSRCVPSGMIWFGILDNDFRREKGREDFTMSKPEVGLPASVPSSYVDDSNPSLRNCLAVVCFAGG